MAAVGLPALETCLAGALWRAAAGPESCGNAWLHAPPGTELDGRLPSRGVCAVVQVFNGAGVRVVARAVRGIVDNEIHCTVVYMQ